ncbi:MAG: SDR family oxidoreductase [Myxococcales bacterium]|nr:SDR family oxidoreductase [Myxococcales bacterium]
MGTRRGKGEKKRLVITGISGRLGRQLARALHNDFEIIGIDRRGARHLPPDVVVHDFDIRRKACEDIFRRQRIEAVVHLNILHNLHKNSDERHTFNVGGTHRILDYCVKHGVNKFVLLSSANVYGADPTNHQFFNEEAPLMAASAFSLIRDLVEIDIYTNSFFWRHPEVDAVVLRPVNIVGPVGNAISNYLRLKNPPTVLGFDPMLQLVHMDDVVEAMRLALRPGIRGVFNITGPGSIALSVLQRQLGRRKIPLPDAVVRPITKLMWDLRLTTFPPAELDFIKYVCMVDGSRAREVLGYRPQKTLRETIEAVRY